MLLEIICMFRNSSHYLLPCLDNWVKYADRILLVEGGKSKDNCVQLVREYIKNNHLKDKITLRHIAFTDFASARNRCFQYSSNECEFQMIMDDTYRIVNKNLRNELENISPDVRSVECWIESQYTKYKIRRIIRTKSGLRYQGKIHECIHDFSSALIPTITIRDESNDYMVQRTEDRLLYDLKCLEVCETPRELYQKALMCYKGFFKGLFTLSEVKEVFLTRIKYDSSDIEENFMARVFLAHALMSVHHDKQSVDPNLKKEIFKLYLEASIMYPPRAGECYYFIFLLTGLPMYIKRAYDCRDIGTFRLPIDQSIYSNTCEGVSMIEIAYNQVYS